jgi:hypothetical protein
VGGAILTLWRSFLSANKRRSAACNGSYRPPIGDSKALVCGFQKSHALSIAADRDIVICGATYILVRIVLQTPSQANQCCHSTRDDRGHWAGYRRRSGDAGRGCCSEGLRSGAKRSFSRCLSLPW